jgi:hypothetical protein
MFETIKSSFINFVESAKLHNIDVVQPEQERITSQFLAYCLRCLAGGQCSACKYVCYDGRRTNEPTKNKTGWHVINFMHVKRFKGEENSEVVSGLIFVSCRCARMNNGFVVIVIRFLLCSLSLSLYRTA